MLTGLNRFVAQTEHQLEWIIQGKSLQSNEVIQVAIDIKIGLQCMQTSLKK